MAWRATTPFLWSGVLVNDCHNAASASRAFTQHQRKDIQPLTDLACSRHILFRLRQPRYIIHPKAVQAYYSPHGSPGVLFIPRQPRYIIHPKAVQAYYSPYGSPGELFTPRQPRYIIHAKAVQAYYSPIRQKVCFGLTQSDQFFLRNSSTVYSRAFKGLAQIL
ncbi:hypothetical protein AVEN_207121-1 [Araneus ventricosus]|uniref:Uncharacterized protein n=1 Tax=Araneus ventricosus TaxID=182803 RepID=A0A4Y2JFG6_ARAVE|nr:hypothetical protein AVEN_207121-1 [Araneus ventricosus]